MARALPRGGDPLDRRAAREPEPQELGDLVEGLARGVVARLADALVAAPRARDVQRGMAARDHEREERKAGRLRFEEGGVDVTFEVVHADERQAAGIGDGLGHGAPDQEAADQSRPLGDREPVELGQAQAGDLERPPHDRPHDLEMPPRRQLGHDAAIRCMDVVLGGHDAREHLAAAVEDRGGRLVTGGLDAENDHARVIIGEMGGGLRAPPAL